MVSVSCFGVRVSVMFYFMFVLYTFSLVWVAVMFHFMFVLYTFSLVWVAGGPPFGK